MIRMFYKGSYLRLLKVVVSMRLVVKPGAELTTVADSKVRLCYQGLLHVLFQEGQKLIAEKSSRQNTLSEVFSQKFMHGLHAETCCNRRFTT